MRTAKLFHAIVVVGASLTACGGDDDAGTDAAVADAGSDATVLADAAIDAALHDDAAVEDAGEDAFVAIL